MAASAQRNPTTYYVVIERQSKLPISRHMFISEAADYIVKRSNYDIWTVVAQDGRTSSAKTRALTLAERKALEARLWPQLFRQDGPLWA